MYPYKRKVYCLSTQRLDLWKIPMILRTNNVSGRNAASILLYQYLWSLLVSKRDNESGLFEVGQFYHFAILINFVTFANMYE
jgi:hypothetical protein